jgi:Mg2+-importing ATPase
VVPLRSRRLELRRDAVGGEWGAAYGLSPSISRALPWSLRYHKGRQTRFAVFMFTASQKKETRIIVSELVSFATNSIDRAYKELDTTASGLSESEAAHRRLTHGSNRIEKEKELNVVLEFFSYFKSPLVIILLIASSISAYFGEMRNAVIIWIMILLSVILDFVEEHSAGNAAKKLLEQVTIQTTVIRNGKEEEVATTEIVPGDILSLSAGDLIPADARVIQADDCFVNQSALTGESLPVEKDAAVPSGKELSISDMSNILFLGTSIVTGSVKAVVLKTGKDTEFGKIASKLTTKQEKSEFENGITSFGYFIMKAILFLVLIIFLLNALINQNILDSFLFAIAVAVGVTPELLPMIMSITMARGSLQMSKKGVIVKKPSAIPSFGSMNILCTDKTGTITEDNIQLVLCTDPQGSKDAEVLRYGYLNSAFQTGIKNPLDQAVLDEEKIDIRAYQKMEEIPFDFHRKMLSIAVKGPEGHLLITKGAPEEVWKRCTTIRINGTSVPLTGETLERTRASYERLSSEGYRVLAVAIKRITQVKTQYQTSDEAQLELIGYLSFLDPPKKGVKRILKELNAIGVEIKIITGDNELVTSKICNDINLTVKGILLGKEIESLTDDALRVKASATTIFARFSPDQKNRVILALRSAGNVVGYMGDGINDAPSLRTADVGISVNNAVDVAREAAAMVLTRKSLKTLKEGILEGRKTFGNTMKYVLMGLSSNFGNMFSMIAAVLFLPFLPMLPIQILLNNLLYDFSQVTLPVDNVDDDWIDKPRRWNFKYIKKFMITLGPISSFYDVLTFVILYFGFHASQSVFQTGWFIESLATQTLVIHFIRTKKIPFIQSKPGKLLVISTLSAVTLGWIIPFTPVGEYFHFAPLPWVILMTIGAIVIAYLGTVELLKRFFYARYDFTFQRTEKIQ